MTVPMTRSCSRTTCATTTRRTRRMPCWRSSTTASSTKRRQRPEPCWAQYPDVHDGWDRLGMVHEKRGENRQAADCYRKVVAFLDENLDHSEPAFKDAFVARIAKLDPPA